MYPEIPGFRIFGIPEFWKIRISGNPGFPGILDFRNSGIPEQIIDIAEFWIKITMCFAFSYTLRLAQFFTPQVDSCLDLDFR